jgi:hypothetical protein
MPVLTQAPTLGDLLTFELNASYCRETVTLKAGTSYPIGAVLGRITASGKYRLSPNGAVTGERVRRPPSPCCWRRSTPPPPIRPA